MTSRGPLQSKFFCKCIFHFIYPKCRGSSLREGKKGNNHIPKDYVILHKVTQIIINLKSINF